MNTATQSSRWRLAQAFLRDVRSPEWGVLGQMFRFALSGSVVSVVYVSVTTLLHDVLAVPFQIALAAGFLTGVSLHFTLQRVFVWRPYEGFALAVHRQAVRYLCLACSQYGLTALATSQLPALLGLPVEVVYVITIFILAAINFTLFRGRVFHHSSPGPKRDAMS